MIWDKIDEIRQQWARLCRHATIYPDCNLRIALLEHALARLATLNNAPDSQSHDGWRNSADLFVNKIERFLRVRHSRNEHTLGAC